MTTVLSPTVKQHFVDNNGAALFNGQLASFAAGTTTPIATYKDPAGTANTNPIILNARGECDLWLQPNVAYKLTLTDSLSNLIWTVDNVVSSQLITLYGGVDTGTANAYLLNFVANFTAYADGIVIYWIPANTNSGASTINVNGLGVVNIVNQDGTALTGGQLTGNQVATIMFKAGAFQLISSGISASLNSGSWTPVWSGFSVQPVGTMWYQIVGRQVTLEWVGGLGTSNANLMGIGNVPGNIRPASASGATFSMLPTVLIDNGAAALGSMGFGSTSFQFNKGAAPSGTGFTVTGSKGLDNGWTATYLLR